MGVVYKYFQITHDDRAFNPPKLVHDYSITNKNEPKDEILQIYVKDSPEIEYIDFIDSPFLLVSDIFKKAVALYNPGFDYRAVVLAERETKAQSIYWHIDLPTVDCFPAQGNAMARINKIVDTSKVRGLSFFKYQAAKNLLPLYIVRLDLAESILRRSLVGFKLTGLEHM